jgi:hypothetical protein
LNAGGFGKKILPLFRHNCKTRAFLESFFKENNISVGKRVKCSDGLKLTVKGILNLADELFLEYENLKFIIPKKFNQDSLENFFAWIRSNLGMNPNFLFNFSLKSTL